MSNAKRTTPGVEKRVWPGGKITYRATVFDKRTGKRIRKTFDTISAAKTWRSDAAVALRRGELRVQDTPRVGEALDGLLEAIRDGRVRTRSGDAFKPGTVRAYGYAIKDVLKPRLGHLRLHEVRRGDVQAVVDALHADGVSPSHIRNGLDPLRVLFRRAIRDDLVTVNPTLNLDLPAKRPEPKVALAPDHVTRLLDALPEGDRALWATAFYGGLRRGELRSLRWDDVDLAASVICVRRSWDDIEGEQAPKSAAGIRDVLILPQLARMLADHGLRTGRSGSDLVFGRTATVPFAPESIAGRSRTAWKDLGVVTLHHARHCAASFLVAAGLDVKSVQTYMGHADSRMTLDLYAHAMPDRHRDAAAQVEAWLAAGAEGAVEGQRG